MKSLHLFVITILIVFGFVLTGCEDINADTTKLEISVKDDLGNPVENAKVSLFLEYADLQTGEDQIGVSLYTDINGKVLFDNLSPVKYYWFAEKDCQNNYNGGVTTTEALSEGQTNTITSIISSTGNLEFENNSTNPYDVYINGSLTFTAAAGENSILKYRQTGSYTIRVVQKSGYLLYPTDKSYSGTLNCGETLKTTFPFD